MINFTVFWPQTLFSAEPEFWQDVIQPIGKLKNTEINLAFKQQYRFALSEFKHVHSLFSLLTSKDVAKNLEAGINYTIIQARSVDEFFYTQYFRIECELNPTFHLKNNYLLKIRNRYQIIKNEYEPKLTQTFRQRLEFKKNLDFKYLKSIATLNEIFYSIDKSEIHEDRLIPLNFTFKFKDGHSQSIYTMVRWRKTNNHWNPQSIIGSVFNW